MVKSVALSLFFVLFFYGCAEWDLGLGTKDDGLPPPPPVQETAYPFTDTVSYTHLTLPTNREV